MYAQYRHKCCEETAARRYKPITPHWLVKFIRSRVMNSLRTVLL